MESALKTNRMNISGKWFFKEEFETGVSSGIATLTQEDNRIWGEIEMTENIKGEAPLHLIQKLSGIILDRKIVLKGTGYKILNGGDYKSEYSLDNWEGNINSEGKIIGSSIDQEGICGIFVMESK